MLTILMQLFSRLILDLCSYWYGILWLAPCGACLKHITRGSESTMLILSVAHLCFRNSPRIYNHFDNQTILVKFSMCGCNYIVYSFYSAKGCQVVSRHLSVVYNSFCCLARCWIRAGRTTSTSTWKRRCRSLRQQRLSWQKIAMWCGSMMHTR